jgi:hypothetical protein
VLVDEWVDDVPGVDESILPNDVKDRLAKHLKLFHQLFQLPLAVDEVHTD